MAQWVEVLATKPDDLIPSSGTHMMEGQNCLLQVVLRPPHMSYNVYTSTRTHAKEINIKNI